MTTYGLVLSGGGARGAFEAGVTKALEEAGIIPTIIAGTSAGAISGTATAIGLPADDLIDVWCGITSDDVYRLRLDVWNALNPLELLRHPKRLLSSRGHSPLIHLLEAVGWTWFLDTAPLRELLVETIGSEQVQVRDGTKLSVVSVEAATGRLARFTNEAPAASTDPRYRVVDLTVDHVLSSAAIPVLFKPVRFPDGLYTDGGVGANTPLGAALGHKPDVVFVVATGAVDRTNAEPESLSQAISGVVDDLLRFSLVKDVEHAERINELIDALGPDYAGGRYKRIEFHVIAPPPGGAGVDDFLDFEPQRAKLLVEQGLAAGRAAVAAHAASVPSTSPSVATDATPGA